MTYFDVPQAGELNQRILIRTRQDIPMGFDNVQSEFKHQIKTWAKVTQTKSSTYLNSKQTENTITHYFIIRCRHHIDMDSEILWRGVIYRVHRIRRIKISLFLLIECEEIGEDE